MSKAGPNLESQITETVTLLETSPVPDDVLDSIVEDIVGERKFAEAPRLSQAEIIALHREADVDAERINDSGFEAQVRAILESEGVHSGLRVIRDRIRECEDRPEVGLPLRQAAWLAEPPAIAVA